VAPVSVRTTLFPRSVSSALDPSDPHLRPTPKRLRSFEKRPSRSFSDCAIDYVHRAETKFPPHARETTFASGTSCRAAVSLTAHNCVTPGEQPWPLLLTRGTLEHNQPHFRNNAKLLTRSRRHLLIDCCVPRATKEIIVPACRKGNIRTISRRTALSSPRKTETFWAFNPIYI
jgi:hypothetical protein